MNYHNIVRSSDRRASSRRGAKLKNCPRPLIKPTQHWSNCHKIDQSTTTLLILPQHMSIYDNIDIDQCSVYWPVLCYIDNCSEVTLLFDSSSGCCPLVGILMVFVVCWPVCRMYIHLFDSLSGCWVNRRKIDQCCGILINIVANWSIVWYIDQCSEVVILFVSCSWCYSLVGKSINVAIFWSIVWQISFICLLFWVSFSRRKVEQSCRIFINVVGN